MCLSGLGAQEVAPSTRSLELDSDIDQVEALILAARAQQNGCYREGPAVEELPREDETDLVRLNEATYSAAVILFYTRLREVSWKTPFIRHHV
jgi:tetrahydromethanopterin S-methyltransferase subunit A